MTDKDLQNLKDDIAEVKGITLDIHKKLFVGNGKDSLLIQIDRLNVFKRVSMWFLGVITVTTMGLIARLIFEVLSKQG